MYGYIYKTTNLINNKVYIGQHISKEYDKNYIGSGVLLWKAINKYGKENFKNELICECIDQKDSDEKEKFYIKKYKVLLGTNCYNIMNGGKYGATPEYWTEVSRQKFSKKISDIRHSKKFKKYFEDTRKERSKKQSIAMKGHKPSKESRQKASISNRGQKRSNETKQKMKDVWHDTHSSDYKQHATNLGRKAIYKDNIIKFVNINNIEEYLNKGYKLGNSKNRKENLSKESIKKRQESHKGKTPWNKGLSKETSEILRKQSIQISNTLKNKYKNN